MCPRLETTSRPQRTVAAQPRPARVHPHMATRGIAASVWTHRLSHRRLPRRPRTTRQARRLPRASLLADRAGAAASCRCRVRQNGRASASRRRVRAPTHRIRASRRRRGTTAAEACLSPVRAWTRRTRTRREPAWTRTRRGRAQTLRTPMRKTQSCCRDRTGGDPLGPIDCGPQLKGKEKGCAVVLQLAVMWC